MSPLDARLPGLAPGEAVAYIGRKPCGCAVACAVVGDDDGPWRRAAVETDLAWWRRDGLRVEATDVAGVRATRFGCRCGAGRMGRA